MQKTLRIHARETPDERHRVRKLAQLLGKIRGVRVSMTDARQEAVSAYLHDVQREYKESAR